VGFKDSANSTADKCAVAGDNYLGRRVASRRTVTRPVVVVLGAVTRHGPGLGRSPRNGVHVKGIAQRWQRGCEPFAWTEYRGRMRRSGR
jgi:hypothetical protein